MSDIADNNTPVQLEATLFRSPVSESLAQQFGGNINFLLKQRLRYQQFLVSGNFTTPAVYPAGILGVYGVGGGGGGGGGGKFAGRGGSGGFGAMPCFHWLLVNPGDVFAVTIGAGGAGGLGGTATPTLPQNGQNGVVTTFGTRLIFPQGSGGAAGVDASNTNGTGLLTSLNSRGGIMIAPGRGGSGRPSPADTAQAGTSGEDSQFNKVGGTGGAAGLLLGAGGGGGGGGSAFGNGGNAGAGGTGVAGGNGVSAAANSSAGGGGGGGGHSLAAGGNGGAGGSGLLWVVYFGGT